MRVIQVTDPATGETETVELNNDVQIICDDGWYVDGITAYANGTKVVTIKVDKG